MISKKLNHPKVQKYLLNPEGIERWKAAWVARGALNTILKEIEGKDVIEVSENDAAIIRSICRNFLQGNPAYNPFSGGRAFNIRVMLQTPQMIRRALGIYDK